MDSDPGNSGNPGYELEPSQSISNTFRRGTGIIMTYNMNNGSTDRLVPRAPISDDSG
jgi:hypothetical protein